MGDWIPLDCYDYKITCGAQNAKWNNMIKHFDFDIWGAEAIWSDNISNFLLGKLANGAKGELSAQMIMWYCRYVSSAFSEGGVGVFLRRDHSSRFIRQRAAPKGGHRPRLSWSMKDTIMVVSVFAVTLGTGCLIVLTSPLNIQAAKVVASSGRRKHTTGWWSSFRGNFLQDTEVRYKHHR